MISSTDHFTLKTGASPVVNLSKDGAAFGAAGGAVTEIASGWYKVALNTTDTGTLGDLAYYITGTGADDTDFSDQVVVLLPGEVASVNVTQWAGAAVSSAAAGIPKVDIDTIKTNPVVNGGTYTFPANATGASTTNITVATGVDITKILGSAISAPATAGILDVNIKNINNVVAATPGAAGGIVIAGSNAATTFATLTVTGATTFTGNVVYSDGITVSAPSTGNRSGITITGNGTGHGISITGGNGATGDGLFITANSTNGNGVLATGKGSKPGISAQGGLTGNGVLITGGGTSGAALFIQQQISGNGITILAASNGVDITGAGSFGISVEAANGVGVGIDGGGTFGVNVTGQTDGFRVQALGTGQGFKAIGGGTGHGIYGESGTGATGDGLHAEAKSTNGNGIIGVKTGTGKAIKGPLDQVTLADTITTYTGNTPQTGDSYPIVSTLKIKKNTALAKFPFLMVLSADHITPATGLTVVVQRSINGAAFANATNTPATEVANGVYYIDLSAADLNGDTIVLKMTSATADQRIIIIATEP